MAQWNIVELISDEGIKAIDAITGEVICVWSADKLPYVLSEF